MRLLMAFLALGVAMAYIERRPLWQRLVLMGMGIPVAVFTNVLRVTITSYMFVLDRPELGKDFMHEFTGMLMLGPALAMLWLLGWLLQVMFVEEGDETDEEPSDEDDNPSVAGGEVEAS
jgi:exosortase/archaeosortase family protein